MTNGRDQEKAAEERVEEVKQPRVLARLIDARPPFPLIALLDLPACPRPGDNVWPVVSSGQAAAYRVTFVAFYPARQGIKIDIECLPISDHEKSAEALEKTQNEIVDRGVKLLEKGQAYTNAVIAAGYVGAFALWSFLKQSLTPRASSSIAILLGLSLIVFVTWEIYTMIERTLDGRRLHKRAEKDPQVYLSLAEEFRRADRETSARIHRRWLVSLVPSICLGYAAIMLLLYNAAASLIGLPVWP